jgi:sterol 3beta-glucosyltransferase
LTRTIIEAVRKAGVRAILSKGWSGRLKEKKLQQHQQQQQQQPPNPITITSTTSSSPESIDSIEFPDFIYHIDKVPHDWLFPQMSGVLHHGGAGTTSAGIRAGVPTAVRPYFGDQFFWAERVGDVSF